MPDGEEYSFLWQAEHHIRNQGSNPATLLDNWRDTLTDWGIKESLINSILDPAFNQVRLTQTAKETLLETMRDAYRFLLCVSDQRDSQRKSVRTSGPSEGY